MAALKYYSHHNTKAANILKRANVISANVISDRMIIKTANNLCLSYLMSFFLSISILAYKLCWFVRLYASTLTLVVRLKLVGNVHMYVSTNYNMEGDK